MVSIICLRLYFAAQTEGDFIVLPIAPVGSQIWPKRPFSQWMSRILEALLSGEFRRAALTYCIGIDATEGTRR
jgi:hypothetical protein